MAADYSGYSSGATPSKPPSNTLTNPITTGPMAASPSGFHAAAGSPSLGSGQGSVAPASVSMAAPSAGAGTPGWGSPGGAPATMASGSSPSTPASLPAAQSPAVPSSGGGGAMGVGGAGVFPSASPEQRTQIINGMVSNPALFQRGILQPMAMGYDASVAATAYADERHAADQRESRAALEGGTGMLGSAMGKAGPIGRDFLGAREPAGAPLWEGAAPDRQRVAAVGAGGIPQTQAPSKPLLRSATPEETMQAVKAMPPHIAADSHLRATFLKAYGDSLHAEIIDPGKPAAGAIPAEVTTGALGRDQAPAAPKDERSWAGRNILEPATEALESTRRALVAAGLIGPENLPPAEQPKQPVITGTPPPRQKTIEEITPKSAHEDLGLREPTRFGPGVGPEFSSGLGMKPVQPAAKTRQIQEPATTPAKAEEVPAAPVHPMNVPYSLGGAEGTSAYGAGLTRPEVAAEAPEEAAGVPLPRQRPVTIYAGQYDTVEGKNGKQVYDKTGAEPGPVRQLQQRLKDLGDPRYDPGPVDGIAGWRTQRAITRLNRDSGNTHKPIQAAGPQTYTTLTRLEEARGGAPAPETPAETPAPAVTPEPVEGGKAPSRYGSTEVPGAPANDLVEVPAPTGGGSFTSGSRYRSGKETPERAAAVPGTETPEETVRREEGNQPKVKPEPALPVPTPAEKRAAEKEAAKGRNTLSGEDKKGASKLKTGPVPDKKGVEATAEEKAFAAFSKQRDWAHFDELPEASQKAILGNYATRHGNRDYDGLSNEAKKAIDDKNVAKVRQIYEGARGKFAPTSAPVSDPAKARTGLNEGGKKNALTASDIEESMVDLAPREKTALNYRGLNPTLDRGRAFRGAKATAEGPAEEQLATRSLKAQSRYPVGGTPPRQVGGAGIPFETRPAEASTPPAGNALTKSVEPAKTGGKKAYQGDPGALAQKDRTIWQAVKNKAEREGSAQVYVDAYGRTRTYDPARPTPPPSVGGESREPPPRKERKQAR